jgi:predicted Zn-dependent peptidase
MNNEISRTMAGGGHVASRFGQQSVTYNLCHGFQSFNTCYSDTGLWGTYLVTDRMRIDDAMSALQDEWYNLVLIFNWIGSFFLFIIKVSYCNSMY